MRLVSLAMTARTSNATGRRPDPDHPADRRL